MALTQLEQILRNMQLEIDLLKREVRDIKSDNARLREKVGNINGGGMSKQVSTWR